MTCPTCHGPIDERHHDTVGCKLLACRTCRKYAVEGSDVWLDAGPGMLAQLVVLRKQVVEDAARHKFMMESSIEHPVWENHSL